ncbi:uncharacterized protein L201_001461 [Kwoniella dendrophila CBS 6074]|uniref:DUF4048 domain-containing protein n=1 Tax=Kwoniella dendrophila CBS 6074 TaxID=1295534 RepID=A0AAX4JNV4_9TREE
MSLSNPPSTPNTYVNTRIQYSINHTSSPSPNNIIPKNKTNIVGQKHETGNGVKKMIPSTDHHSQHTHDYNYTSYPISRTTNNSGPAPPANLSRLQPQPQLHNNEHHNTLTSGNHTTQTSKGLKPLGMSSSSTLNIPLTPQSHIQGKRPSLHSTTDGSDKRSHSSPTLPTTMTSRQEKRRSMIISPSTPTIIDDNENENEDPLNQSESNGSDTNRSSRNKLKRLSLCAGRPPSLELDRSSISNDKESPVLSSASPSNTHRPIFSHSYSQPSTPMTTTNSNDGTATRRTTDRRMGLRASISYSPSIPLSTSSSSSSSGPHPPILTPRTSERRVFGKGDGWGTDEELNYNVDAEAEERGGSEDESNYNDRRNSGYRFTGVQTLAEKHADLLTHIAQRERRVAELKQELLAQENSLAQLKSRWTTIVSRSALSPTEPTRSSNSSGRPPIHNRAQSTPYNGGPGRRRPASMISTSASTSSTSTSGSSLLSLTTIDEPLMHIPTSAASASALISSSTGTLSNTGAAVLSGLISQTEGYLSPEVVQGGKRFLGNLWKTVEAAAVGTVPPQPQSHAQVHEPPVIRDTTTQDNQVEDRPESGEWNQFGPKLDLANLQKLIIPWDTESTSSSGTSPAPISSMSNHPATTASKTKNGRRTNNDRSNTVTPTSFSRRITTSPPATVGLGFDLNIKPSSSTTTTNLLDDDDDNDNNNEQSNSNKTLSFDDNIGDLGKALTPTKKSSSVLKVKEISDDGWNW